ncbi:hypothetical protein EDD22DRAFT_855473 [Suillus occidentalis]|nr:hypothetical protein EDD22DRAFT_855473 [Suillus occidentalis]
MGREHTPYVSLEELRKHNGLLESGLKQLRSSTLYKGYKAKLAARETARQRLVVTAWEIEESERLTAFLDALHTENEERLGFANEELRSFRSFLSERGHVEVDDDRDYLQAIYEDECEILRVTSAQAKQISKILGSRVKDAFPQSGDAESRSRLPSLEIRDDEGDSIVLDDSDLESEEECLGVGAGDPKPRPHAFPIAVVMLCGYLSVPFTLPTPLEPRQYMPPKRAKGSQLNLDDEQPREPMANSFNPHASYNNFIPSNFNNNALSQAGPSTRVADQSAAHLPFNYNNSQAGPSSSYMPPFNYDEYNARNHGQYDPLEDLYNDPRYPGDLSAFNDMSGTAPDPHHIQVPQSFDDDDDDDPPQEAQYNPITEGEIPGSQVIHTTGPARSSDRRRRARAMPGTPYPTHQDPVQLSVVAATVQRTATTDATASPAGAPLAGENRYFQVTGAVRDQIFQRAKELVLGTVFTKDAMASSSTDKKRIIKAAIRKATPRFPGLRGTPRWENQSKDGTKIWRMVVVVRAHLTSIIRDGIVMGYTLFPPQGSVISAEAFRIERVRCLIRDNCFMHECSFNADGTVTIHAKFKNTFILHVVAKLVWNPRFRLDSLLVSPREQLFHMLGLAGAITSSVLLEQGRLTLTAPRLSLEGNSSTFESICSAMDNLSPEEKASLNEWIDHIVICGVSQQRIKAELSDFDLDSDSADV